MRKRLELNDEELKLHKKEIAKRSNDNRARKNKRIAYREFIMMLLGVIEDLGWTKAELMLGPDEDLVEKILQKVIDDPRFGVTVKSKKLRYNPDVNHGETEIILPNEKA